MGKGDGKGGWGDGVVKGGEGGGTDGCGGDGTTGGEGVVIWADGNWLASLGAFFR